MDRDYEPLIFLSPLLDVLVVPTIMQAKFYVLALLLVFAAGGHAMPSQPTLQIMAGGGSWGDTADLARCAGPVSHSPILALSNFGLRCVRVL